MVDMVKLKELATAATPGLWEIKENLGDDEFWGDWHEIGPLGIPGGKACADSRFIAAANPATVLDLIAEIERLREALIRQTAAMGKDP